MITNKVMCEVSYFQRSTTYIVMIRIAHIHAYLESERGKEFAYVRFKAPDSK